MNMTPQRSLTKAMRHGWAVLSSAVFVVLLAVGTVDGQSSASPRRNPPPTVHEWQVIYDMKQISPGVGWVLADRRLLWTESDRGLWRDITPPGPATEGVQVVYALDRKRIWVVMVDASEDPTLKHWLRLLRTGNTGRTWSTCSFDESLFPTLQQTNPFELFFVDPEHGWFLWRSSERFTNSGALLSTKDGGRTWAELPWPPSGDKFSFHTATEGWITGGDSYESSELWVTHDAGRTWEAKTVPAADTCKECEPRYYLPRFRNSAEGVLAVTFGNFDVTYLTHNGGSSWEISDVFEQNASHRTDVSISEIDMDVVRVFSDQQSIRIRTSTGTLDSSYPASPFSQGRIQLADFVDAAHGWLRFSTGTATRLISTSDGGKTFKVISPTSNAPR